MDRKFSGVSQALSRFRGWIQAGATLLTNLHLPNFLKGGLYQVVAFGTIASQFAKRGLCRGALISVEGTLELEDYLKRDGWTRDKRLKVIALRWRYLQPYDTKVPEQVPEIDGEREPLPG